MNSLSAALSRIVACIHQNFSCRPASQKTFAVKNKYRKASKLTNSYILVNLFEKGRTTIRSQFKVKKNSMKERLCIEHFEYIDSAVNYTLKLEQNKCQTPEEYVKKHNSSIIETMTKDY